MVESYILDSSFPFTIFKVMKPTEKPVYIYESPDKGKTVYRRVKGADHETRELIQSPTLKVPSSLLSSHTFSI